MHPNAMDHAEVWDMALDMALSLGSTYAEASHWADEVVEYMAAHDRIKI